MVTLMCATITVVRPTRDFSLCEGTFQLRNLPSALPSNCEIFQGDDGGGGQGREPSNCETFQLRSLPSAEPSKCEAFQLRNFSNAEPVGSPSSPPRSFPLVPISPSLPPPPSLPPYPPLRHPRLGRFRNWKLQRLEGFAIGRFRNWKVAHSEDFAIGRFLHIRRNSKCFCVFFSVLVPRLRPDVLPGAVRRRRRPRL